MYMYQTGAPHLQTVYKFIITKKANEKSEVLKGQTKVFWSDTKIYTCTLQLQNKQILKRTFYLLRKGGMVRKLSDVH